MKLTRLIKPQTPTTVFMFGSVPQFILPTPLVAMSAKINGITPTKNAIKAQNEKGEEKTSEIQSQNPLQHLSTSLQQ